MKKKKIVVLCSRSSWNVKLGEIRQFHVVVVQRRKRKFTKRATHVVVLLIRPTAFLSFSLPSPSSFLKQYLISQKKECLKVIYTFSLVERMKSAESLTLKMINGKLSHLEWQGKWSYAHLCRFTDGRLIMCLKKAQSVFLNGTDCRYTPDTFIQTLG